MATPTAPLTCWPITSSALQANERRHDANESVTTTNLGMQVVDFHALPLHYLQLGVQTLAGRHNDCCTSAAVVSLKTTWKSEDKLLTLDFVFLPSIFAVSASSLCTVF